MKFSKIKLQMLKEQNFEYNSEVIKSTIDIVKYINNIEELERATEESTILICLDVANQIVAYSEVAKGGINYCMLDLKTIFKTVLLSNASKFILLHNHPSGMARISSQDRDVTEKIKKSAKIMDIQFIDHVVVAGNDFVSCMS